MLTRTCRKFSINSITMALSQQDLFSRMPQGDQAIFVKQDAHSHPAISFEMNRRQHRFEFGPETSLATFRDNMQRDL